MRSNLSQEQRARFEAIGFLVSIWALAEIMLDFVVGKAFHKWGRNCPERVPPQALKRKLQFLKKFIAAHDMDFRSPRTLASVRANLNQMIADAIKLGEDRHWVVHGSAYGSIFQSLEKLEFMKARHGGSATRVTKTFALAEIDALSRRAAKLVMQLLAFAAFGIRVIPENEFYKMSPEFARELAAAFPGLELPSEQGAKFGGNLWNA